jgi:hypothetical protein
MGKRRLKHTRKAPKRRKARTQRRRRQRGGSYTDPRDATVNTVAGVPITKNPVVVIGNKTMSYKDFQDLVERAATEQIDPVD